MTPPLYNPVAGFIRSLSWVRPTGNTEFKVTSPFGYRDLNGDGDTTDPGEFHTGVDLGNKGCGAPVYAVLAGVVAFSGTKPGLNGQPANVITIDHGNGLVTEYVHLQDRAVAKGATVSVGKVIGHHGKTGASACHLHFVASLNGVKNDPYRMLWQNKRGHAVGSEVRFRATAGSGSTYGAIYATIDGNNRIRRASDNKDLGDYRADRALRQPIVGATYTLAGATGNLWLPYQLDVQVFIAKPLVLVA
jgi:murein DD-endopeptidase MepM/ murein hydrolase activator NlpD